MTATNRSQVYFSECALIRTINVHSLPHLPHQEVRYMLTLIAVDIQVVGGRENGDEGGESSGLALSVHLVPSVLRLVSTNDGEEIVALKKLT